MEAAELPLPSRGAEVADLARSAHTDEGSRGVHALPAG